LCYVSQNKAYLSKWLPTIRISYLQHNHLCVSNIKKAKRLTGWKIIGDDVMRNVSMQNHLETSQRIISQRSVTEDPVDLFERRYLDVVVEDDRPRRFDVALDARAFQKYHLRVVVRVRAHLELATLQICKTIFLNL